MGRVLQYNNTVNSNKFRIDKMLNFYFNFKICFLIKNVIPFFENIHSCFIIITINIIRRKRIKKIRETFNGDHKFAVKNIYKKYIFYYIY